jgi:hypothetical protein
VGICISAGSIIAFWLGQAANGWGLIMDSVLRLPPTLTITRISILGLFAARTDEILYEVKEIVV